VKHLKISATADGGLIIEGYGVPFGGPIKGKDLHGQYFSKKTDFALDLIPDGQRPLLFQHGLDSAVDTAVIGRWGVKKIDDGGVWVRAQLDARSEYINEIKELVDNDALGFSSGTMGHLVKVSSKTGEILKWALVELSLTPNPANPNAYIVRANKSAAAHVKSLFATKHGDHDQSEHGNWATGGGSDKGGRAEVGKKGTESERTAVMSAITSIPKEDRYVHLLHAVAVDKALEKGNYTEAMTAAGKGRAEANRLGASSIATEFQRLNIAISKIAADEYDNRVVRDLTGGSNAAPKEKTIYRDLTKTRGSNRMLKVKRSVKHGDHDQSEHGNWANGGGSDKGGSSDRPKTGDEKGYNGWTNRNTWSMGLHTDGVFEDDAKQALEDHNGDAAAAARDLGSVISNSIDEDFQANGLNSTAANDLTVGAIERIDWNAIADNFILDAGGSETWKGSDNFRQGTEEEHNGWTNRATWLGSLYIDNEGLMGGSDSIRDLAKTALEDAGGDSEKARYELAKTLGQNVYEEVDQASTDRNGGASNGFIAAMFEEGKADVNWTEVASHVVDGFAEPKKSFRIKRSTKHGDHDQSEHGNWASGGGSGSGRGKEAGNAPHPGWLTEDIAYQKAGLLAELVGRLNIPEISNVQKLTEEVAGGRHQSVVYATAKSPSARNSVIEKIRADGWDAKADPDSKRGVIVKPSSGPKPPDIGGASYPDRESDPVYAAWDSQRQVKP
jgi:hypothetical protein